MTASPFDMHHAAFVAAQTAYNRHRDDCQPKDADDHEANRAYEQSYAPLVQAMNDAGIAAVRCPAATVAELADKLEIFRSEQMSDLENVGDFIDVFIEDARRIGGAI